MKRTGLIIAILGFLFFAAAARAQWLPAKRLTWTPSSSVCPVIAVDLWGKLHVVWQEGIPSDSSHEIFYLQSPDGGATWSAIKRLTWTSGYSSVPALSVDPSGHLHVAWMDDTSGGDEVYYKKSTDGGASWTASRMISWTSSLSVYPAIAADSSGHLHAGWQDYTPGNPEIYYRMSPDGGGLWTASKRLTWNSSPSQNPAICAESPGHVHVVWHDYKPGNAEIYYRSSTDGGAIWTVSKRLTWTSGLSLDPAIAIYPSGHLHVVWVDRTPGNSEIYYKNSPDGGVSWSPNKRLTWSLGDGYCPTLSGDPYGHLHVVWDDGTPGNEEIYYKQSTDGGASWTPSKRLTWTSVNSWYPVIAVDSFGNLHIVWYDLTPGNWEIYYRKYIH
jgi:hypothetical protein